MALEGCAACLKYLMIVWNFLILILGVAILGVGVWMVVDKESAAKLDEVVKTHDGYNPNFTDASGVGLYEALAYVLIVIGAITLIIAFLGCCGALRESQCMLGTSFILLFIIFGCLVGSGIYLYVEKDEVDFNEDEIKPELRRVLTEGVDNYYTDPKAKSFMDDIQTEYACCGVDNAVKDYKSITVPDSCGSIIDRGCLEPYYNDVISKIGVTQIFSGKMTIAMGVVLGAAGGLIVAMILTLCLCCSVRRSGSY